MTARHLRIMGHVQGIGYRDWMVTEARRLGLSGWVRNLRDGSVEALVDGAEPAVEELLRACRRGPRLADVSAIEERLADADQIGTPGFRRLPSV